MATVKLNGQTGIMQGFDTQSGAWHIATQLAWSDESRNEIYKNLRAWGGNGELVKVEVTEAQAKKLQEWGDYEIEW